MSEDKINEEQRTYIDSTIVQYSRFGERKRRETTPHRRAGRARQRSGRANGDRGERLTVCTMITFTKSSYWRNTTCYTLKPAAVRALTEELCHRAHYQHERQATLFRCHVFKVQDAWD